MIWTKKEFTDLRKHYPESSWDEITSRIPDRSSRAIMAMASAMKVKRKRIRKYTPCMEMVPLVERRKTAKICQIDFAVESGYGLDVIGRIESGKRKPNKFHLQDYNDTLERFGA